MEFVLGLVIGLLVGWLLRSRWRPANPYKAKRPRRFDVATWLAIGGDAYALRSIDPDRMAAVLSRIATGRNLTFRNSTGRQRLMTRGEFEKLRLELVNRQFARRNRKGSITPTPLGRHYAQEFLTRARTAQMHKRK